MSSMIEITTQACPVCEEVSTLEVFRSGFDSWMDGAFVQDAFPELSADERELLISGTHSDCWDSLEWEFDCE